ncbi:MAG: GC-type dockerin domain-anchored protein [Planctomycetota bacterium]
MVSVTVSVDSDTGAASAGVFGPAGFYGFGGEIIVSGPQGPEVSGSTATLIADLPSGQAIGTNVGSAAVRAGAGRGLLDALLATTTDVLSIDLQIDPAAPEGEFSLDFEGVVVLVEGDALVSYATSPGINQNGLGVSTLTITIGESGCNAADLAAPFNVLDLGDVDAFIPAFIAGGSGADLAAPFGVIDLADIDAFIAAFLAGCP